MIFDIRFGSADDTMTITDNILEAGGGIFEQLFEDVFPGVRTRDLVSMAVCDEKSPLNHRNALIAEHDGRAQGMALCYPATAYGLPAIARTMVPRSRFEPVRHVLNSRIENSFYVNTLVVGAEARGQGLARLLIETASALAEAEGFDLLSLHAWMDNPPALRLYTDLGFATTQLFPVVPSPYLKFAGPMALMSAPLLRDRRGTIDPGA